MPHISAYTLETFFENAHKKAKITEDRKCLLVKIASAITTEYAEEKVVNLNFIGTGNSRTSQLLQAWSFFGAHYFQLNINNFSGGTEITSLHRNTVKTLQKVGFTFQLSDFSHQNPKYEISFDGTKKSILGFSKLYSNSTRMATFMVVTTSNKAHKNCPFIPNASHQFNLPFMDLTEFDETENKYEVYLEISKQIASEIYFIFNEVRKSLS